MPIAGDLGGGPEGPSDGKARRFVLQSPRPVLGPSRTEGINPTYVDLGPRKTPTSA